MKTKSMATPLVQPDFLESVAKKWAENSKGGKHRDKNCGLQPLEWFIEQAILETMQHLMDLENATKGTPQ